MHLVYIRCTLLVHIHTHPLLPTHTSSHSFHLNTAQGAPKLGDFYLDTKGDRDNLLYHALYRNDVAVYRRLDPGLLGGARHRGAHAYSRFVCFFERGRGCLSGYVQCMQEGVCVWVSLSLCVCVYAHVFCDIHCACMQLHTRMRLRCARCGETFTHGQIQTQHHSHTCIPVVTPKHHHIHMHTLFSAWVCVVGCMCGVGCVCVLVARRPRAGWEIPTMSMIQCEHLRI